MPLFSHSFRTKAVLAGAVIALAIGAAACTPAKAMMGFKNELVRYRVTVEIETPEGIKIGSAVREVGAYTEPSILPDQGGTSYNITKGEAVVIDLGQRGVVFALLGDQHEARVVSRALRLEGKLAIDMPSQRFVRFRDLNDPKTVEAVKSDDFAAVYGAGVLLKSVRAEYTEQEPTIGTVINYLPWLAGRKGKRGTLGGGDSITQDPTDTWLTGSEFSVGVYW